MFTESEGCGVNITETMEKLNEAFNVLNKGFFNKMCVLLGIKRKFNDEQRSLLRKRIIELSTDILTGNSIETDYGFYRELSPNLGYVNGRAFDYYLLTLLDRLLYNSISVKNKICTESCTYKNTFKGVVLVNDELLTFFEPRVGSSFKYYSEDTEVLLKDFSSLVEEKHNKDLKGFIRRKRTTSIIRLTDEYRKRFSEFLTMFIEDILTGERTPHDDSFMEFLRLSRDSFEDVLDNFESNLRDKLIAILFEINFRNSARTYGIKSVRSNSELTTVILIVENN